MPAPADLDDAIARARAGDPEAYGRVIAAVQGEVRAVVAAIVPRRSLSEDAIQEVFVTGWRKLGDYRAGSDPVAWFKAIARNIALNARRGWRRQQELRRSYRTELDRLIEPRALAFADGAGGRLLELLDGCLEALAEPGRTLVREHYWEDRDAETIAAARGRDAGWARVTLHRLRAALADCLRAKGAAGG
jgi:RNA polymerase sigma-70 factor, ECF subfamily